jgi:hypothetical protein
MVRQAHHAMIFAFNHVQNTILSLSKDDICLPAAGRDFEIWHSLKWCQEAR